MITSHYALVDVSDNQTVISTVPTKLYGIYVDTVLSAHAVGISDGSTTVFSLIASLAAGQNLEYPGVIFEDGLVIDPNASSTGDIVVFYTL